MRDLDREIEVIENIVTILNKCLAVYAKENMPISELLKDIKICKKELKLLIEARADAKGKEKDAAI